MIASVVVILSVVSSAVNTDLRIVNGENAKLGEFPFMVSLQNNSFHICGATVLNRKYVMTAAHCACNLNLVDLKIHITYSLSNEGTKIPINSITCHNFSSIEHINDIALLELNYTIPKEICHPVKLIQENFSTESNLDGVLIGFGLNSTKGFLPEELQKVNVIVYNDTICRSSHFEMYNMDINMCAGWPENGRGSCQGDSGGPLLVNGLQAGIISFGAAGDCGISSINKPKVLTRVSRYLDWIKENTKLPPEPEGLNGSCTKNQFSLSFSIILLIFSIILCNKSPILI